MTPDVLTRAKAGDREAMGQIIADNEAALCAISRRYHGEIEDNRQEARMAAIFAVQDYDPCGPYKFGTILRNRVRWWLRDKQRQRRISAGKFLDGMASTEDGTLAALIAGEERSAFWAAVKRLPESRRRVVLMRMEGLTFKQIGAATGVSIERARQIEVKACRDLRYMLEARRAA